MGAAATKSLRQAVQTSNGHSYVNDRCPICAGPGEEYLRKSWEGTEYAIDKCTACGFVYTRNVPSDAFLRDAYRLIYHVDGAYAPDTRFHKRLKNWYFAKRIRFHARAGRRVLEIGYAQGHLLQALQRQGVFELEGIDYSEGPLDHLKSLGLNVSIASLQNKQYPSGHFDVVVGLHVLEHVQDPASFVREIHRVLSARGRLFLQVPCVTHWRARRAGKDWRQFVPPFHLWYFSPRTIRLFLSQHGYRVISARCLSNRAHLTVVAEKA